MSIHPALVSKLTSLANGFRVTGGGLLGLAVLAFLMSRSDAGWPANALTFVLANMATAGVVLLICGHLLNRKLMGFAGIESQ
jgi:hypothetical protein